MNINAVFYGVSASLTASLFTLGLSIVTNYIYEQTTLVAMTEFFTLASTISNLKVSAADTFSVRGQASIHSSKIKSLKINTLKIGTLLV
jgi:hypothetical protein